MSCEKISRSYGPVLEWNDYKIHNSRRASIRRSHLLPRRTVMAAAHMVRYGEYPRLSLCARSTTDRQGMEPRPCITAYHAQAQMEIPPCSELSHYFSAVGGVESPVIARPSNLVFSHGPAPKQSSPQSRAIPRRPSTFGPSSFDGSQAKHTAWIASAHDARHPYVWASQ